MFWALQEKSNIFFQLLAIVDDNKAKHLWLGCVKMSDDRAVTEALMLKLQVNLVNKFFDKARDLEIDEFLAMMPSSDMFFRPTVARTANFNI
jgi:hypothetical protein